MFVWIFHRISGVVLIFLFAFQLLTGFFQASDSNAAAVKAVARLHNHATVVILLVLLTTFHALYGVRTILLDCGVRRERLVFWVCTALGAVLFGTFLVLYLAYVVR